MTDRRVLFPAAPQETRKFKVIASFSTLAAAEAFARKIEKKYAYMQVEVKPGV